MEVKVTKRLNETTQIIVTAQGNSIQDCLFLVNPIVNAPSECGLCRSPNISIDSKYVKNGGHKYTSYQCKACGARMQFGAFKEIPGAFFLKDWEKKYQAEGRE